MVRGSSSSLSALRLITTYIATCSSVKRQYNNSIHLVCSNWERRRRGRLRARALVHAARVGWWFGVRRVDCRIWGGLLRHQLLFAHLVFANNEKNKTTSTTTVCMKWIKFDHMQCVETQLNPRKLSHLLHATR